MKHKFTNVLLALHTWEQNSNHVPWKSFTIPVERCTYFHSYQRTIRILHFKMKIERERKNAQSENGCRDIEIHLTTLLCVFPSCIANKDTSSFRIVLVLNTILFPSRLIPSGDGKFSHSNLWMLKCEQLHRIHLSVYNFA